jgi:small subunit ribosomal protein S16
MPVKLRLRRQGRKRHPYFHIVAADARSPRDGKFIETVGVYDATRVPAEISINHEVALKWLRQGAQPTDTVQAILKYTGVNFKHHLLRKGLSAEEVEAAYQKWVADSQSRIDQKKSTISAEKSKAAQEQLARESKQRADKAAKILAKTVPPAEEVVAEEATSEVVAEVQDNANEAAADAPAETPAE